MLVYIKFYVVELEPGKASNSKQFSWSGGAVQTFILVLRHYLTNLGQDLNSFRVRSLHTLSHMLR